MMVASGAVCQTPLPVAAGAPTTMPRVHDPSTVVKWHGVYYVFTTGRGMPILSSPDGVSWTRRGAVFKAIPGTVRAAVPLNDGLDVWAPDVMYANGEWRIYYAVSHWNSFVSAVALVTNPTLDPDDAAYKWTDRGVVVRSDGVENLNAIDPGVVMGPDGRMWLCYGSYHGTIDLIELDAKTGLRVRAGSGPGTGISVIAGGSEAADIIYRDGYYYLFVNHGSCCQGKNSTYNIRVGRAKTATGPYVDEAGAPLTKAPGKMFLAGHDHRIGPGHFGRLVEDGVERFSLHYEADLENDGKPTLGLRPLLWSKDGWPVAGDNLGAGVYQLGVRGSSDVMEVSKAAGAVGSLRVAAYFCAGRQQWTLSQGPRGLFGITNLETGEALTVRDGKVVFAAAGVGEEGLWAVEEFPDGAYRIVNKGSGLALMRDGARGVGVGAFVRDDAHLWGIGTP